MALLEISDIVADTEKLQKSYDIKIKQKPAVGHASSPARR